MSEPTRRDREVAIAVAQFTSEVLTSRSLYEREELAIRDACGPDVQRYREACERAERVRLLTELLAFTKANTERHVTGSWGEYIDALSVGDVERFAAAQRLLP
jgi:hypothetical protein